MLPPSTLMLTSNITIECLSLSINIGAILLTELQILIDFTSFSTNIFVPGFHIGQNIAFSQQCLPTLLQLCQFLRLLFF